MRRPQESGLSTRTGRATPRRLALCCHPRDICRCLSGARCRHEKRISGKVNRAELVCLPRESYCAYGARVAHNFLAKGYRMILFSRVVEFGAIITKSVVVVANSSFVLR